MKKVTCMISTCILLALLIICFVIPNPQSIPTPLANGAFNGGANGSFSGGANGGFNGGEGGQFADELPPPPVI